MKEFSTLFNTTNTFIPRREDVEEIIAAALNAADPYTAVVSNTRLYENHVQIGRHEYSLTPRSRLIVIGLGKTALAILNGNLLVTLATDGEDGPTDAAGAVVDSNSLMRAYTLGFNPERYLANNDAYTFFKQMGDLLVTASTDTHVNDISFIFGF